MSFAVIDVQTRLAGELMRCGLTHKQQVLVQRWPSIEDPAFDHYRPSNPIRHLGASLQQFEYVSSQSSVSMERLQRQADDKLTLR